MSDAESTGGPALAVMSFGFKFAARIGDRVRGRIQLLLPAVDKRQLVDQTLFFDLDGAAGCV